MNQKEDHEIIVGLALIDKTLKELANKVDITHKTLYGNGVVEGSIIWEVKQISQRLTKVEKHLEQVVQELSVLECKKGACKPQSWSDVFKLAVIKSPYALAIIIGIVLVYQPAFSVLLKLLNIFVPEIDTVAATGM